MRSTNKRSRSKSNRPKSLGNIVNRVFDSSGPEGKVRGTPQQIIDKYLLLARDAQLSGDRVAAENFLQHAEHYTRMLSEAQREMTREAEARQLQQGNNNQNQNRRYDQRDDGDGGQANADAAEAQGGDRQNDHRQSDRQNDQRQNDHRQNDRQGERQGDGGGNRRSVRRDDRPERQERQERPERQERSEQPDRPENQDRRQRQQRPPSDPRENRDDGDTMLVETPESRAEKPQAARKEVPVTENVGTPAPKARRTAAQTQNPVPQDETPAQEASAPAATPADTGASISSSEDKPAPKPRKPRAAPATRRAPRKPKAEGEAPEQGAQDSDTARVAE